MHGSRRFTYLYLTLEAAVFLTVCAACGRPSQQGKTNAGAATTTAPALAIPPLSADDVSLLFPAPTRVEDFGNLIALRDLATQNPQDSTKRDPVWADTVFQQFLAIAASPAAQVSGTVRIGLPAEVQTIDAWFIAGIRIDAGAPGLSNDIRTQFGQIPQIRLIVQPVTRNPDGTPHVHDIAGHLIFNFTLAKANNPAQPGCLERPVPDLQSFNAIVEELAAIRTKLSNGQLGTNKIATSGVPLGVHPGLADPTTASNLRLEIKSFLERHISASRLSAMAVAGLPAGAHEPWIFLSMVGVPPGVTPSLPNGGFVPVHGPALDGQQFAQMLTPAGTVPRVVPAPHTNNSNPITCRNAAVSATSLPIANRSGVATADVFGASLPLPEKTKEILDVIADTNKSHFFNTDCVSCHTETRRSMELLKVTSIPGIDSAALPNGPWDVRNFGWAPGKGSFQATVTRRTANETAAVVALINSEMLAKQQ
jgi:hypothetical protein